MTHDEVMDTLTSVEGEMLRTLPVLTRLYRDSPEGLRESVFNILDKFLDTATCIEMMVTDEERV